MGDKITSVNVRADLKITAPEVARWFVCNIVFPAVIDNDVSFNDYSVGTEGEVVALHAPVETYCPPTIAAGRYGK